MNDEMYQRVVSDHVSGPGIESAPDRERVIAKQRELIAILGRLVALKDQAIDLLTRINADLRQTNTTLHQHIGVLVGAAPRVETSDETSEAVPR